MDELEKRIETLQERIKETNEAHAKELDEERARRKRDLKVRGSMITSRDYVLNCASLTDEH